MEDLLNAEVTQFGRALAFQARSCEFEPRSPLQLRKHTANYFWI